MVLPQNPVRDGHQALAEQWDVEAQLRGSQIHGFFLFRKKIDQDSADRAFIENVCDMPISRASPAAAAPVSENYKALRASWQSNIGSEFDAIDGYLYSDVLRS
jgi:hypothetical protein